MIGGLLKSASRVALFAAAGLFVGGVAMPSAKAADLGGDCCADLEERVAELEATTARKGNRRVSLTVSGQVNTALMVWDQGGDSAAFIVDNGVSRSGFQFDGTAKINPNLTAGFQLVIGLATGARSHQTSQFNESLTATTPQAAGGDDGGANADGTLGVELANWFLRHETLGELRVGRINSASAGTTVVDLGGAGVIANAQAQLWAGNFRLTQGGALSSQDFRWSSLMGGATMGISGLSRQNAISYTTPTLAGFSLQAAWGEQDAVDDGMWDVAVRYAGEFSGFRVAAAASYGKNAGNTSDAEDSVGVPGVAAQALYGDGADIRKWQGSASVLHVASGLYLTGAYARQQYTGTSPGELVLGVLANGNRPDTTMWYLQGGISQNWTGLGKTVLYGEYGRFNDGATGLISAGAPGIGDEINDSRMDFWGLGIVQHIDAAAMEVYLSYRQFRAEIVSGPAIGLQTGDLDELSVFMGGARIRF